MTAKTHEHWEIIPANVTNNGDKDMLSLDPLSGHVITIEPGDTRQVNVTVNFPPPPHWRIP